MDIDGSIPARLQAVAQLAEPVVPRQPDCFSVSRDDDPFFRQVSKELTHIGANFGRVCFESNAEINDERTDASLARAALQNFIRYLIQDKDPLRCLQYLLASSPIKLPFDPRRKLWSRRIRDRRHYIAASGTRTGGGI